MGDKGGKKDKEKNKHQGRRQSQLSDDLRLLVITNSAGR